jgi:hypothetical protein
MKSRSFNNLNCRTRGGWKQCARKMRCTQLTLMPAASAMATPANASLAERGLRSTSPQSKLRDDTNSRFYPIFAAIFTRLARDLASIFRMT